MLAGSLVLMLVDLLATKVTKVNGLGFFREEYIFYILSYARDDVPALSVDETGVMLGIQSVALSVVM